MDSQAVVYRSDDYGAHWNKIYDFGPVQDSEFHLVNPYCTGVLAGSLDHLFLQADMGMYESTDQGHSWFRRGGPSYHHQFTNQMFYSAKGVTYAGKVYNDGGAIVSDGLWKLDLNTQAATNSRDRASDLTIEGPYPNPSSGAAGQVTIEVKGERTGVITSQIFDILGNPVGAPVTVASAGDTSKKIALPSPSTKGTYFIRIRSGAQSTTRTYIVN